MPKKPTEKPDFRLGKPSVKNKIDPKAYAKRLTEAKKTLAKTDPAVKRKIAEMYPKVTKKQIVKKALSPKAKPSNTAKPKVQTPKRKTLDDFLLKGKRPPMKMPPGVKRPSDADVIIKGYNDPATIKKYTKKYNKK
jgi:hypothetical protein